MKIEIVCGFLNLFKKKSHVFICQLSNIWGVFDISPFCEMAKKGWEENTVIDIAVFRK
jgi:hypothetical protein